MGKIGDLFVKLGLKKDEFDKGVKDAKGSLQELGGGIKKIGAAGAAVWAAIGVGVTKLAQEFVTKTQKMGDRWELFTAGIRGGWDRFVRQLSSGEGFDNLISNINRAARAAREAKASMDEMFERQISLSYETAEAEREISKLDLIRVDTSKSDAEREAAAKRIIELREQVGQSAMDVAAQEQEAARKMFKAQTDLNDTQIDQLLKDYNKNRELIQQAQDYNQALATAANADNAIKAASQSANPTAIKRAEADANAAKAALAGYGEEVKRWADAVKRYDLGNDELVENLVKADLAYIQAETNMNRLKRRAVSTLGSLNKDSGSGAAAPDTSEYDAAIKIAEAAAESQKSKLQIESEGYQQSLAALNKYNLDSEDLTRQHIDKIKEIVGAGAYIYQDVIPDIDWDIEGDMEGANNYLAQMSESAIANFDQMRDAALELSDTLATGVVDGVNYLADALFGLEDFNAASLLSSLLTPLADMAQKEGAILIASGMGIEAIKKSLQSLNGVAAIAAGTALVAAAAAVKSGLSSLASSSSASTSSSYGGGSSASTQTIESEMTIYVTGRLSGQDILLSGQKTASNWAR